MSTKLYCGNLSYQTSRAELERLFAAHGAVSAVEVATDSTSGQGSGFGYVEFENADEAAAAADALDGAEFHGRVLIVSVARPRVDCCAGGGGPAGGRGGQGWAIPAQHGAE